MTAAGAEIRHPTLADYLALTRLSLLWGSSFLAIKIAVDHGVPPLTVAAFRIGLGALLLLTIARVRDQHWPPLRTRGDARLWLRILFLGVVGNSLPFFLISWGEQTTTSQLAGILMAIIPMLVVILAHFFTHDERLNAMKLVGVALGFGGVIVLVGIDALRGLGAQVLGQALIIGGCISYSLYGVGARRLPRLAPDLLIGVILLAGFVAILPFWLIIDRPWALAWQWQGAAALAWLGLLATGTGNLLYFLLLRKAGAGFASNNNYLVPLLALVYGYFILGEQPHLNAVAALVLILVGLAVQRMGVRRRLVPQAATTTD
ncbi:MAG TPA: DMT family transporter [Dongiaceae bacterium]|jgi:drug/metabolite transporter (DMT)-like permease|nr:DMT family transporter [Dongiaceae bacterium]